MQTIRVNLGQRSYDIRLASGDSTEFVQFVGQAAPRRSGALVVTDSHIEPLAATIVADLNVAGTRANLAVVPAGEESKSFARTVELYDKLADLPADRSTLVVAVGGGVIGDLAGFAAATYNRGLPLLMVPTTLLSMVDSSVGGKVGVNHPRGKNLIGAFHQPVGVWINPVALSTLPDREYRSGLAEVVKYGVILDSELFEFLEENAEKILARADGPLAHIVGRSCQLKATVVEQDEHETTGLRAILNYGHTFAHAYETVGGYGHWLHGEAVAAGMIAASQLAERLGLIPQDLTERQAGLLRRFGLPTAAESGWSPDDLIAVMRRDKKAQAGKLRFILPTRLGHVDQFADIPEPLVREVLRTCH